MSHSTFQFAKHYGAMVLVMFAGMGAFFAVALGLTAAAGSDYGEFRDDAPAAILFGMGLGMTAAMIWWMDRRRHSRRASQAMALSMILPTLLSLGLLASGAVTDLDTLVTLEHAVMLPAMLVAMLPFRAEFGHRHATP